MFLLDPAARATPREIPNSSRQGIDQHFSFGRS
jgi:hypothetical protein